MRKVRQRDIVFPSTLANAWQSQTSQPRRAAPRSTHLTSSHATAPAHFRQGDQEKMCSKAQSTLYLALKYTPRDGEKKKLGMAKKANQQDYNKSDHLVLVPFSLFIQKSWL